MQAHLFVYGSLVTAALHANGARLRSEALLLGAATIPGRLYRVSWYPALRSAHAADEVVHGEVYRLTDPARSLAWLDEYEGILQGAQSAAASDEYVRAERHVRIATGDTMLAWVYLYQRELPETGFVASGRWLG